MTATAYQPWPSARESGDRAARDRAKLEMLVEENRQLRDKIAELTGRNDVWAARRAYDLTESQGRILMALVRCGRAEYLHLHECICEGRDWDRDGADDPEGSIRTHAKRLRRKIRPHGLDIGTVYSFGYVMGDEARAKIRAAIAGVAG